MVKLSQRTNLAISFGILVVTALALFSLESVEMFSITTPVIHNKVALTALDSCNQTGGECVCTVLEQCTPCPSSQPLPPECEVTGRREQVSCSPGNAKFYQQCWRSSEDEARRNSFWVFYLSSGVMLIGSVIAVNHRKQFLDQASAAAKSEEI